MAGEGPTDGAGFIEGKVALAGTDGAINGGAAEVAAGSRQAFPPDLPGERSPRNRNSLPPNLLRMVAASAAAAGGLAT